MKFLALISGLALLAAVPSAAQSVPPEASSIPRCSAKSIRKEVRNLSPAEWQAYSDALQRMVSSGWHNWFGYLHEQVSGVVHGNAKFLAFHRRFIQDYESVLQRFNPSVTLPYWNAGVDFQKPSNSPIFSSRYFGGNGESGTQCVKNGVAKGWTINYPQNHCLKRQFNDGDNIKSWYSPEYLTSILQTSKNYDELRYNIEFSIHGIVHLSINGDMGTMYSPTDPVFWLHHSNIDRLFAQWQAVDPSAREFQYNGNDLDNNPVNISDMLAKYNEPVYSVMRLGYGNMCYTYDTIDNNNLSKRDGVKKCVHNPLIDQLPKDVINEFYPSFANGSAHPLENEMTNLRPTAPMAADGDNSNYKPVDICGCLRGKMPEPSKLSPEWVKMQGGEQCEVDKLESRAKAHADALNKADYLSPYMY